jgi:glycosyltransferase involved in cell wall biosynthesis
MPRRRLDDFDQLRTIFALNGKLHGWNLVELKGMVEAQVASTLQRSALFMSLSRDEGFGLPPAEAIACGCHVIGSHGQGGREYFLAPFAEAIEDGDVIGLAEAVEAFVTTYDDRRTELDRVAAEGSRWILSEYSAEHQGADLLAAFGDILERGRPARTPTRVLHPRQVEGLLPRAGRARAAIRDLGRRVLR